MTARIKTANLACYCDQNLTLALYQQVVIVQIQGRRPRFLPPACWCPLDGGIPFNRGERHGIDSRIYHTRSGAAVDFPQPFDDILPANPTRCSSARGNVVLNPRQPGFAHKRGCLGSFTCPRASISYDITSWSGKSRLSGLTRRSPSLLRGPSRWAGSRRTSWILVSWPHIQRPCLEQLSYPGSSFRSHSHGIPPD